MKRFSVIIALMLAAALLLSGCAKTGESAATSAAASASASKSAAQSPSAAVSPSEKPEDVVLKVAGSTSVGPVIEALAEMYTETHTNVTINVEQTGSGAGVTSCGDGTADLGMASRNLKDEEKAQYPDMKTTVLCIDGVAVVVSKDNPVTALSKADVKKIFTGEITNWSQVGGTAGTIKLFSRDSVSGTREAFQNLFLGKNDAGEEIKIDDTMCIIVGSNGEMGTQVGQDPLAIGYMSLGLVASYNVNGLTIDGVEATTENLASGAYKYSRPFNLLTMGEPTGEVKKFMDYCLSDPAAIAYMQEKGYLIP